MILSRFARSAERNFMATNTQWQNAAAMIAEESCKECHVVRIKQIRKLPAQPVYNMEVENTHCFAVNGGIIVHNCEDATRYLCKTLYTPRRLATL